MVELERIKLVVCMVMLCEGLVPLRAMLRNWRFVSELKVKRARNGFGTSKYNNLRSCLVRSDVLSPD